jgi:hypothetical protein
MYKKKENPITGGGRPKIQIDKDIFEGLCKIQCTVLEVCAILGHDDKAITSWCRDTYGLSFAESLKKQGEQGKSSLRRLQWKSAQDGNVTMQIWLGKQYLNQSDKAEMTGKDGSDFTIRLVGA